MKYSKETMKYQPYQSYETIQVKENRCLHVKIIEDYITENFLLNFFYTKSKFSFKDDKDRTLVNGK